MIVRHSSPQAWRRLQWAITDTEAVFIAKDIANAIERAERAGLTDTTQAIYTALTIDWSDSDYRQA